MDRIALIDYLESLIMNIRSDEFMVQKSKAIDASKRANNDFETRKVILIINGKTRRFGV